MLNIFLFGLFRLQPLECEPGTRHLSASCENLLLLSESVYSLSTIILHGWNIKPFSTPVFKSGSIQQLWKRQRLNHVSLEAIFPATVRKLFWNTAVKGWPLNSTGLLCLTHRSSDSSIHITLVNRYWCFQLGDSLEWKPKWSVFKKRGRTVLTIYYKLYV